MTTQEPPEHPKDSRPGIWSRLELLQMNARFVAAMERALAEEGRQRTPEQSRLSSEAHPKRAA
jgi:hypothetical protein